MRMNRDALFLLIASFTFLLPINGDNSYHLQQMKAMRELRSSISSRRQLAAGDAPAPSPVSISPSPQQMAQVGDSPRVYDVTSYGADPTGGRDSTDAFSTVLSDLVKGPTSGTMLKDIKNFGGAQIHLAGGNYLISKPLRFPSAGVGNVVIVGGSLRASDDFPTDGYLIDLSSKSSSDYDYEYITLRDLMLDSNFRGGGIFLNDAVRITIDNCYVTHFTTDGVGVMITGQANILTGVHCYNKASGFGGTGIYIKLPGLSQTRIVNSYMDFTGITVEDPVQLTISDTFFLGGAYVVFKSVKGVAKGVSVVNNMFSGSGGDTVRLEGEFNEIGGVLVDGNSVNGGMNLKATVARGSTSANGTSWTVDFNSELLFPNRISHAQYSLVSSTAGAFPRHALRNITGNVVVVESDVPVTASVFAAVSQ
ncbi:unnamed protein product [Linum tenue]|uniref:Pectate lyase superfamily protein domain-containing protein n=1 Tax=Linum tenue TaxID=586396 RepID=A0AAV0IV54_9ROSI|nr:unnamed protein product [Linum tenue]